MILAAGRGIRLRPLTDTTPKPLIEAGGKPLVQWHLESLADAGIREVVINLAHLGDRIAEAVGDGARFGLTITYSREPEGALETGGGIRQALPLLGAKPFLLINGDVWTDLYPGELPRTLGGDLGHLVLVPNPPENEQGDFALAGGRVLNKGEKRFTYAGIAVLDPALIEGTSPGHFPLTPLLRRAADEGRLSGRLHEGRWFDTGTPERLAALRQHLGDQRQ